MCIPEWSDTVAANIFLFILIICCSVLMFSFTFYFSFLFPNVELLCSRHNVFLLWTLLVPFTTKVFMVEEVCHNNSTGKLTQLLT